MIFPLAGNEKIKTAVLNAISKKRIPHAIIIEGEEGLGKHTLSDFLSMAAVCGEDNAPCKVCKNCHLADIKSHPDISVTLPEEGKKNISVAQIRSLKNETFVKPHQAKKRVFVIDGANTMNEQSQNALLKVLEEPPGDIVFILITESKAALLDTIISRCVTFTLSPPEQTLAVEYLKTRTDSQTEEIELAIKEAGCNIGKALNLLSGKSDSKTVSAAKDFLQSILRGDEYSALCACAPFDKKRVEADRFFKDLKNEIALYIKKNSSKSGIKGMAALYARFPDYERALLTNINLSLLFSTLCADSSELIT